MSESESNSEDFDVKIVYKLRYKPRESKVKIFNEPIKLQNIEPKVNSLDQVNYVPKAGAFVIENNPVKWNAQAKVGSFDNISYKPGGGAVKIETLKLNWDAKPRINTIFEQKELFTPRTNQITNYKLNWDNIQAKINSLDYHLSYSPIDDAGQTITFAIEPPPLDLSNVKSKIKHLTENPTYKPSTNRSVNIVDQKLQWTAKSKLNTFEKVNYQSKGGNVKINNYKVDFNKNAKSTLDTGLERVIIKQPKFELNQSQNLSPENSTNDLNETVHSERSDISTGDDKRFNDDLVFGDLAENELVENTENIETNHEKTTLSIKDENDLTKVKQKFYIVDFINL